MKKRLTYIILFLFLGSLFAGNEIFKEYNAQPETNKVVISWVTLKETNIQHIHLNCYPTTFRRNLIDFAVQIVSTGKIIWSDHQPGCYENQL